MIHLLEDPLAEEFLSGRIGKGDSVIVDVDDYKQVDIRKQGEAAIPALPGAGVQGLAQTSRSEAWEPQAFCEQ